MAANYSIISYSFKRTFEQGSMDIHSYIHFCRENGFTQIDPWMKHLERALEDRAWLSSVTDTAKAVGLPFGCLAVDGGHIYEETAEARAQTKRVREAWLDIAERIGANMIRIDAGGPEEMPGPAFEIILAGYNELIPQARERGLQVIVENHWGPTKHPDNVVRLLEAVDGLGLLFDTGNWAEGQAERGWELCAKYASLTHIKTHAFDDKGNETTSDVPKAIGILQREGYGGAWGIESTTDDGDEIEHARKSLALIKRVLGDRA